MDNTLYPNINIKSETETKTMIDEALNKSRVSKMLKKRDELTKDLKHYKKIGKRWSQLESAISFIGVGIGLTTAIGAGISLSILIPPVVPLVLAGLSATDIALTKIVAMGLTSRK